MRPMRLRAAAVTIAVVLVLGFFISAPRAKESRKAADAATTTLIPSVTLRDNYKKGTHTITGSLPVQNACTRASAEAMLTGSADGIRVDIVLTPYDGVCLQLSAEATFTVTIQASSDLPIEATIDGTPAPTTVL